MQYNIFTKTKKEIDDFENTSIKIAGTKQDESARFLKRESKGYLFNQKDTLELIELYYNSQYESGKLDSDGLRKVFLNISKFRADVAAKQTDVDVKDYVFVPDSQESEWPTWFLSRQFKIWARENNYGQLLNDLNRDYSKYGTCVIKPLKDSIERVPIRTIKNTQDAKSLKHAASSGGYVIIENDLTLTEMKKFPDWNTEELDYDKRYKVYERYALVPKSLIKDHTLENFDDDEEMVESMAVIILDTKETDSPTGKVLFIEECECPLEEAHWDKIDGRWLGVGEIENQFENQVARNMIANMRRRALIWGSKKVFQTTDDTAVNNFVREVQDGEVLKVSPNGQITQVAMESRNLPEFAQDEAVWEKNSDQKSFTYESVTGASMPSGTPFRLGVLVSQAAQSHFELKKENFALFLNRSFFNLLIPIFKKQSRGKGKLTIANTTEGIEHLKQAVVSLVKNQIAAEVIFNGGKVDTNLIEQQVQESLSKQKFMFFKNVDQIYDKAQFYMELDITDEARNTQAEIESLTTLYQSMVQAQDPRASKVADRIIALTGKISVEAIAGSPTQNMNAMLPQQAQGMQGGLPANAMAA